MKKVGYGFTPVPNEVWRSLKTLRLTEAEMCVLAVIGDRVWNWEGCKDGCRVSHSELARETGLSESASKRALHRLMERKLVVQVGSHTNKQAARYSIDPAAFKCQSGSAGEGSRAPSGPTARGGSRALSSPNLEGAHATPLDSQLRGPTDPLRGGSRAPSGVGSRAPSEGAHAPTLEDPPGLTPRATAPALQTPYTDTLLQTPLQQTPPMVSPGNLVARPAATPRELAPERPPTNRQGTAPAELTQSSEAAPRVLVLDSATTGGGEGDE